MDSSPPHETLFARILLPLNLQQLYTYRVPAELNNSIQIGQRVVVPFGKNKVYSGLIYQLDNMPPLKYEAKYLLEILDSEPLVDRSQFSFWAWIASYYMCSMGQVMSAALPAGLKLEGESKLILNPEFGRETNELDPTETEILLILENHMEMKISSLADLIKPRSVHKYLKSLYLKNALFLKEDLESSYKPKLESIISLSEEYAEENRLNQLFDELEKRAPKQQQALMLLLSEGKIKTPASNDLQYSMPWKQLQSRGISSASVKALISKDVFLKKEVEVSRLDQYAQSQPEIQLNEEQSEALLQIEEAFTKAQPVLLHGITSSGKTHIYIKLIREYLDKGDQVLYLLPEIALTSQLLDRLALYFGKQLLVSHSKFSSNERVEIYNRVRSGEPILVIGTRSAIFQPFQNIGLILVDEEHENSFKQFEPAPRFHARDAAVYLAHQEKAQIVLGSATPSIESYHNALTGKYKLVELRQRFQSSSLPEIVLVDMKIQRKQKRNRGIFSDELLDSIEAEKRNGKQSILFQNRKGYVPVLECTLCSWTPKCINCDISLTYYKFQNNLRCHYCGYSREPYHQCAACGNDSLEMIGYGTERIEDELALYSEDLNLQRLDYDTTRRKTAHKKIINRFEKGEIDVLIGTQMVSKGLDFDRVNLVAVMNADHLLNFPDFRAAERSFQLMTQVAGRAGRRDEKGRVLIQTAKPGHPVLEHIISTDYIGFYKDEIAEREHFFYPPFSRLIRITLKHKDALELHKAGQLAERQFSIFFGTKMLGPEKPYIGKVRNLYLLNFLLKLENQNKALQTDKTKLREALNILNRQSEFKSVKFVIDVDPQ